MTIHFVQASELPPSIFCPRSSLHASFTLLERVIFPNGIHPGMFACPFSLFVFLVTIPFLF